MSHTKYLLLATVSASILVLAACQSEQTHSVEYYKGLGWEKVVELSRSDKCAISSYKDRDKLSQNCKNIFEARIQLEKGSINFPVVPKRQK